VKLNFKEMLPTPERMVLEVIIVTAGVLGAAFLISRFPAIQRFVQASAVTVKTEAGEILF
jgi:hypothetical protein